MASQSSTDLVAGASQAAEFRTLRELKGQLGWHFGAAVKVAAIFTACLLATPVQALVLRAAPRGWWVLPGSVSRAIAWLVGVRVAVHGRPAHGPVLFVSNHISWLDIPVIGGRLKASFVAKGEVAGWGGFGTMARLYRTVFIERGRRQATAAQRDEIAARLNGGDSLILFAEGTSTDGTVVKPFKTALFGVAQSLPDLKVQPVTIAYTHVNGMPLSRSQRPLIGWFGDMELTSHVWQALRLGRIRAVIQFHEPLTLRDAGTRKALAAASQAAVAQGLAAANSGRLP